METGDEFDWDCRDRLCVSESSTPNNHKLSQPCPIRPSLASLVQNASALRTCKLNEAGCLLRRSHKEQRNQLESLPCSICSISSAKPFFLGGRGGCLTSFYGAGVEIRFIRSAVVSAPNTRSLGTGMSPYGLVKVRSIHSPDEPRFSVAQ